MPTGDKTGVAMRCRLHVCRRQLMSILMDRMWPWPHVLQSANAWLTCDLSNHDMTWHKQKLMQSDDNGMGGAKKGETGQHTGKNA